MFSKELRLRKNSEFESIYKKGRYYPSKFLVLYILKKESNNLRCGFSVSKKVSKKAVERNKVKRRLMHIIAQESLSMKNNFDLVFTARVGIINLSFEEIRDLVITLIKKADLYKLNDNPSVS